MAEFKWGHDSIRRIIKIYPLILLCLILSRFVLGNPVPVDGIVEKETEARRILDGLTKSGEIPGIQYIAMNQERVLFSHAAGWADIENRIPMTLDTAMLIYSTCKVLTSAAVLRLFDQGKLDLDDPLEKFLPETPFKGKGVTLRRIMCHISGIPEPEGVRWTHFQDRHAAFDRKSSLERLIADFPDLIAEPGTKYQYSNLGFALLGEVIEKVSGKTYEDFMRTEIFSPLKIIPEEMGFRYRDPRFHAVGYLDAVSGDRRSLHAVWAESPTDENDRWLWITKFWHMNYPSHGGVIGSSRGYVKFLQDQLGSDSVLFSRETKALYYQRHKYAGGAPARHALGWVAGKTEDGEMVYRHGGGGFGYLIQIQLFPEKNFASVMMMNRSRYSYQSLVDRLDRLFIK